MVHLLLPEPPSSGAGHLIKTLYLYCIFVRNASLSIKEAGWAQHQPASILRACRERDLIRVDMIQAVRCRGSEDMEIRLVVQLSQQKQLGAEKQTRNLQATEWIKINHGIYLENISQLYFFNKVLQTLDVITCHPMVGQRKQLIMLYVHLIQTDDYMWSHSVPCGSLLLL